MKSQRFSGAKATPPSWEERLPEGPFAEALELCRQGENQASLELLQPLLQDPTRGGDDPDATVREAALLVGWNLHFLGRNNEAGQWLAAARAREWLPDSDPESRLIQLWIEVDVGARYEHVIERTSHFIDTHLTRLDVLLARYLNLRGVAYMRLGKNEKAREDFDQGYLLARLLQNDLLRATLSNSLGTIMMKLSRLGLALRYLREALTLFKLLKRKAFCHVCNVNMAMVFYKLGRFQDARNSLSAPLGAPAREIRVITRCRAILAQGRVHYFQGELAAARECLQESLRIAVANGFPREKCLAEQSLGQVSFREEDSQAAARHFDRARVIAQEIAPASDLMPGILRCAGECEAVTGHPDEAISTLTEALWLADQLEDRYEQGAIHRCLSLAHASRKAWDPAREHSDRAEACLGACEARHQAARAHFQAAQNLLAQSEDASQPTPVPLLLEDAWQHALVHHEILEDLNQKAEMSRADSLLADIARRRHAVASRPRQLSPTAIPGPDRPGEDANEIVAASPAMRKVLWLAEVFAREDTPVTITGETGTGKELVARRIHTLSRRGARPLVAVNCSAVPATLFEREFFGHARGAFSGADRDGIGFVEQADGSTILLDEVGELPGDLQPKLLRLVQEGTFNRLGDPRERRTDVRIIAVTNANLAALVEAGRFRRDLYYRLKVMEIEIPPLRDHPRDIIPLLEHFLSLREGRRTSAAGYFDEASIWALNRYAWPGNVREVAMVAQRAHVFLQAEGRVKLSLGEGDEAISLSGPGRDKGDTTARKPGARGLARGQLLKLLAETGGNKAEIARRLGVARSTVYRWLKRHHIQS